MQPVFVARVQSGTKFSDRWSSFNNFSIYHNSTLNNIKHNHKKELYGRFAKAFLVNIDSK